VSSIEPIGPVSGSPKLRPLRRRTREQEPEQDEQGEQPNDRREPEEDGPKPLVDIRA
jgi:hypothetical protein